MKIYRSRHGHILGVCQGIEESLGLPAKYTRTLIILIAVISKGWIVLAAYLLTALLLPLKGSETWNIKENFDTLGEDSRKKLKDEYSDFMRMLRSWTSKENSEE